MSPPTFPTGRAAPPRSGAGAPGRATDLLADPVRGTVIDVVTPEGVPLPFVVASLGDRATAVFIDLMILLGGYLGVLVLALLATGGRFSSSFIGAFALLAAFLLRTCYFTWGEARRASTIGKRRLDLRVMDARGGALTVEAVIVRNLLRELELFLPIVLLLAPDALVPGRSGLLRAFSAFWLLGIAMVPLVNRRRQRIGDLLAGTIVVVRPKAVLLADLGSAPAPSRRGAPTTAHAFTDAQLDVYGIYELQVLEEVLRRGKTTSADRDALKAVTDRITTKIRWEGVRKGLDEEAFLRDFYAALRARLEHAMLLGRRKADKNA